ncbi:Tripartite ATP-independent transporter DctM subunit OS=Ureibacillus acetophenoni OX=614649 GN=SAMN05877842_107142 PE=4 SV=1 [Ureibacillus acetophenoni]
MSIGTGTILSAMSGSAVANAAMLGSTLAAEMQKRGYHLKMIVGPITAAGILAVIVPPSTLAILLASTARISVGDVLMAGIIPGLIISLSLLIYYITLGYLRPNLAPNYEVEKFSTKERFKSLLTDVIPVASLIFFVLGLIMLGIVTPTESAATGALGAILISIGYRKFNLKMLYNALAGTVKVSGMILLIIAASAGFSQILSYTGATRQLVSFVISWDVAPMITILIMLVIILILGMFIEPISIMMITVPLFYPIIEAMQFDPIWFAILMLICLALGNITPPFGLLLFVMKGVLSKDVKIVNIYQSVVAVVVLNLVVVALLIIFPDLVTWLPYINKE